MIDQLSGRLIEFSPAHAVVDCNGVGYYCHITLNTFSALGAKDHVILKTHLAIRDDAHVLYGFADENERSMFRLLISVSGVGASTGRMILSALSPGEVAAAIANEDVPLLKSIKGIGAKSAQRIIIDLKDKIEKIGVSVDNSVNSGNTIKNEALSALVVLGFDRKGSDKVLDKVMGENAGLGLDEVIKQALKRL
ncbi:MAG: Holliday junction branch migration protein RuvA [Flavobacteriales bacterium]|nr:Holliday junction branch migration protein RuvA [Flavobacteriales bacterium]